MSENEVTGLSVLARELLPGDVVMNEWSGNLMTVQKVDLLPMQSVELHCVREDGKPELLIGNWQVVTRLITRTTAAQKTKTTPSNYGAWEALNAKKRNKVRRKAIS